MSKLNILNDNENLPFKASRKEYLTEKYNNIYDCKFSRPWYNSDKIKNPWFILNNVIKKFKGDSFDNAFSYYCKFVKREDQELFIEYFFPKKQWRFDSDFVLVNNIITESTNSWRNRRSHKNKFNSKKEYYEYMAAKRKDERKDIQYKKNKKYFMLTNKELAKKYKLPFDKTSL